MRERNRVKYHQRRSFQDRRRKVCTTDTDPDDRSEIMRERNRVKYHQRRSFQDRRRKVCTTGFLALQFIVRCLKVPTPKHQYTKCGKQLSEETDDTEDGHFRKGPHSKSKNAQFRGPKIQGGKRATGVRPGRDVDVSDGEQHSQEELSVTAGKELKTSKSGNSVHSGPNKNMTDSVKDGPFSNQNNRQF